MTDPTPLLVPMRLQALVVNKFVRGQAFQRWANDYAKLNDLLDPIPAAFENIENQPPDEGVHLHWKLPAALTRGTGDSTSGVKFLTTPNRWLVVRLATTASSTVAPQLTAWVIQSDYLNADGVTPYATLNSQTGRVVPTRIGKIHQIDQWKGEPGGKLFLTATGIADVTFTAYQPGLLGVYSFFDNTTRLASNTLLTYLVCGWYSDQAEDPLAKKTPEFLNWQVFPSGATPKLSVLHGLLHGVAWQTDRAPDRVDDSAKSMKIGVGYNSVDALAAVIAGGKGSGSDLEIRLQAFQHDMLHTLDKHDGMAQLEQRIREAWFGSTPSGTRWEIALEPRGQRNPNEPLDRGTVPPPPPLTAAQEKWLADLNVAQRTYDALRRDLMSAQWELFTLWWKSQRGKAEGVDDIQFNFKIKLEVILEWINEALSTSKPDSIYNAVVAQKKQVETLERNVPDAASPASIDDWSKKIPTGPIAGLILKPVALPSFAHPADPVLLIAGITPPPNDLDDSKPLPCRTVEAAVTGVKVGSRPVTRTSGSLSTIIQFPVTAATNLPPAVITSINALALETFFADTNNADCIVIKGLGSSDAGTINALRTAMGNGTAQISTMDQPLQAGFAFAPWKQAWSPLYLQWDLKWYPTVGEKNPDDPAMPPPEARVSGSGQRDTWPFDPGGWSFDGGDDVFQRGSEYYRWTGDDIWKARKIEPQTRVGRTFLTPHATLLIIRRLADYVRLHPDDAKLAELQQLINEIGQTRFLSQALSGFNATFAMRALRQSPPPKANTPIASAVGDEDRGVPLVETGDQNFAFGGGTPFFFPVRGGFFLFDRLMIVDTFGQVLNLLEANGNSSGMKETFAPFRGAGLVPDTDGVLPAPKARLLRQVPRLVPPSRLELRLLDAGDDAKEIFYATGTNPVCGWLLPNHLDRSIAVYDAGGIPLASLLVLADASGPTVRWLPAPGSPAPVTDPARIPNKHLAQTFSAFTAAQGGIPIAQRVDAFRALLASIDETLWMIDPEGEDHDLAVLIGRPLAMVRAQLQFELFGRPPKNLSWRNTLQNQTARLEASRFPIRLGSTELLDDGLIGYFTGTSYTTFNAVHPASKPTSPYVKAVGPGNYLSLPFDYPKYSTQNLTLLLDPRANVHATTGVLPIVSLQLPTQFYAAALRQLAVTFRSGPVVTSAATIRMPIPAERRGDWSFIRRTGTGTTPNDYATAAIVPSNETARLEDAPPHLVDGWLRFVPKEKE